jgi:phospho-N-acetylmuramoyl-pentapeptide-transferase
MNFLSRGQTWLPLFTFFIGALVGLLDDYFEINESSDYFAGGLSLKKRLFIVLILSLIGGYWFFFKLGVSTIAIPFFGELALGSFFIPFFALVMLFIYSGGIIDGIDGLSGGVFATIFSAYGLIAFLQNQIDLAALSFVVVGSLLAFLWFNIPPARFYMSETGTMALTLLLTVVAFLTKQVGVLPIIAFPLVATTLSAIINVTSKKFRGGKKVFLSTPIHHHFEAIGWPGYKVAMRYWVISVVAAIIGLIIALIG